MISKKGRRIHSSFRFVKVNIMELNIDNFQINETSEVYIVAEIGINHNGDIEIAKELIKVAKKLAAML